MTIDKDNSLELIKELGGGGFATTYETRIINPRVLRKWKCEEIVAVKIPKDEECAIDLSKEIELNNTIKTICSVHEMDYFCEVYGVHAFNSNFGPKLVMVMKFMPEGNLRSKMEKNLLDVEKTVSYIKDILRGLCVIHRTRIIHRDIKPENILFMNGKPRISDLGIGIALHSKDYAKSMVGTLYYMSPELLMGDKGATFNTDIWSLGIMFHEMLYGCLPFGMQYDHAQGQIMTAIMNNYELSSPERKDIPEEIVSILHKSLIKDNAKRYQTAQEMLEEIEKCECKSVKQSEDYNRFLEKRSNKEYDSAMVFLDNLIRKFPKCPDLYIDLGRIYHSQSRINNALDVLKAGITEIPDCGNLYFEAGLLLNEINEMGQAIEYLQNSIKWGISERKNSIIAQTLIKNLTSTK